MTNYRRLISYIYAYEGEVKGKNIGFVKLESRGGQCKLSVNVKKVYVGSSDLGVYLLATGKEIFLGSIFIRSGSGEFRAAVNVENVADTGYSMDQCYGLTIHEQGDAWRAYTTIWEDAVAHAAEVELADVTSGRMEDAETKIYRKVAELDQELRAAQDVECMEMGTPSDMLHNEQMIPEPEPEPEPEPKPKPESEPEPEPEPASGRRSPDDQKLEEHENLKAGEAGDSDSADKAEDAGGEDTVGGENAMGSADAIGGAGTISKPCIKPDMEQNMEEEKALPAKGQIQQPASQNRNPAWNFGPMTGMGEPGQSEPVPESWIPLQPDNLPESRTVPMPNIMTRPGMPRRQNPMGTRRLNEPVSSSPATPEPAAPAPTAAPAPPAAPAPTSPLSPAQNVQPETPAGQIITDRTEETEGRPTGQTTGDTAEQTPGETPGKPQAEAAPVIDTGEETFAIGDPRELERLEQEEQQYSLPQQMWESFRKRYPKIRAFDSTSGCEILTIKPQDIGLLPRENWNFGNNSFLLHGYYNYRYLILARIGDESKGRARYILGVPGNYYSNEKYMASMFGFPHFVLAKKQPSQDGRFGYWYTDVKLENRD